MATIAEQYSLVYPVIIVTSSTCQRGENFKHGILQVCEFLGWRHQTRHIGTPGQGHHDAVYKNDLRCTLHVLGTCTEFAPIFIYFRLQAKPIDLHGSKLVSRQSFWGKRARVIVVTGAGGTKSTCQGEKALYVSVDYPSL